MNNNTNIDSVSSSGSQWVCTTCFWKWAMLGADTDLSIAILLYSKRNVLIFYRLQCVWTAWDDNQVCFSMQNWIILKGEQKSDQTGIIISQHLGEKNSLFSNTGIDSAHSGANCCCLGTARTKLLTNITICWACCNTAASNSLCLLEN